MLTVKYDILADWMLNVYCNFSCRYCFLSKNDQLKDLRYRGHENIEKIIDFFDNSGLEWLIHMSGGEPFIHQRFVELCKGLTRNHYISINTNLSLSTVDEFSEKIDPQRVAFINCSLHYQERIKRYPIDQFIKKYHKLKKMGFLNFATQVFDPSIIKDFSKIFDFFKEKSIIVRPKVLRGFVDKKQYPEDYTDEERKIFIKYSLLADKLEPLSLSTVHINPILDQKFLTGYLSWKGLKCNAGRQSVWIKFNGDIVRCEASNKILGNIFEGKLNLLKEASTCPYSICPCPYYGLKYAETNPKLLRINRLTAGLKDIYRTYFK